MPKKRSQPKREKPAKPARNLPMKTGTYYGDLPPRRRQPKPVK